MKNAIEYENSGRAYENPARFIYNAYTSIVFSLILIDRELKQREGKTKSKTTALILSILIAGLLSGD